MANMQKKVIIFRKNLWCPWAFSFLMTGKNGFQIWNQHEKIHKIGLLQGVFAKKHTISSPPNSRQLRHGNRFRAERVNRLTTRKTIRHFIPNLLNKTSDQVLNSINSISINSFKRRIKKIYLNTYAEECNIINCYICGIN